jgi:hypothetical protein
MRPKFIANFPLAFKTLIFYRGLLFSEVRTCSQNQCQFAPPFLLAWSHPASPPCSGPSRDIPLVTRIISVGRRCSLGAQQCRMGWGNWLTHLASA